MFTYALAISLQEASHFSFILYDQTALMPLRISRQAPTAIPIKSSGLYPTSFRRLVLRITKSLAGPQEVIDILFGASITSCHEFSNQQPLTITNITTNIDNAILTRYFYSLPVSIHYAIYQITIIIITPIYCCFSAFVDQKYSLRGMTTPEHRSKLPHSGSLRASD